MSALMDSIVYVIPPPTDIRFKYTAKFLKQYRVVTDVPVTPKLLWKHGILPLDALLYDSNKYEISQYLSYIAEERAWKINKPHEELLNDKVRFNKVLGDLGYGTYLPRQFGMLEGTKVGEERVPFIELLDRENSLVIKGRTGATGERVHIVRVDTDGQLHFDNHQCTSRELRENITSLDGYHITEYCEQAQYIHSIYPHTANTVRILTMNPMGDDPFIAAAVHRIGTHTSGHVDNFSQGGLSANIFDDGELSDAVRIDGNQVSWHGVHPDTGAMIRGVSVPHWDEITTTILELAEQLPELPYIGWDLIVVTDGGFKILEGNTNSDVNLLQAHEPLLRSESTRAFYLEHDVIKHR